MHSPETQRARDLRNDMSGTERRVWYRLRGRRLAGPTRHCGPTSPASGEVKLFLLFMGGGLVLPIYGEVALSSPFMGRWPCPPHLWGGGLVLPIYGEVALSSPFMGRWPEGPEGLVNLRFPRWTD